MSENVLEVEGNATSHTIIYDSMVESVSAFLLIKFTERSHAVCIYNISTREATPWIETTVEKQKHFYALQSPNNGVGYGLPKRNTD